MLKKIMSVVSALCLLLVCVGCNNAQTTSSGEAIAENQTVSDIQAKEISLLYSYSDNFGPYTATTQLNRKLSTLLYDSLIKTDKSFNAAMSLAESYVYENNTCTVTIKSAAFTDGSAVTADDVIYSYNLAKSHTEYSYNFYEVVSVTAQNKSTVVFKLSQNDEYFINLLDFPIVKNGTSGVTTPDGKEVPPIGSGRYYFDEEKTSLLLNENYHGKKGQIKAIRLINSPDAASTSHYVEIGATQIYYNDDNNIVRMSGKKTDVNLNRFVYIGVNSSYGSLQTKEMRYAISSALNRKAICQSAYYNNATAASGFFNPYFEPTKAVQTIIDTPNPKITVENLEKIGYNSMNANGFYANGSGNNPSFSLLVNSENASRVAAARLIAEQCAAAGIEIKVVECSYAQYLERLSSNSFQLYLGEILLPANMDFSPLAVSGGAVAYGVGLEPAEVPEPQGEEQAEPQEKKSSCQAILEAYHSGECGISDVASTLLTEMPQIPVCYRSGVLFYDSQITGGVQSSSSDIYLSIENYEF